jgi:hypothetical protein
MTFKLKSSLHRRAFGQLVCHDRISGLLLLVVVLSWLGSQFSVLTHSKQQSVVLISSVTKKLKLDRNTRENIQ